MLPCAGTPAAKKKTLQRAVARGLVKRIGNSNYDYQYEAVQVKSRVPARATTPVPMSSSLEEGSDSKDSQGKNMETHEDMSSSFPQPPVENMETCPQVSSLTSQSTTGESANGDMGTPLVAREDDPTDEEVINAATDPTFWNE